VESGALSDLALSGLLHDRLGLQMAVTDLLDNAPQSLRAQGRGRGNVPVQQHCKVTLENFVGRCREHLKLEEAEEVAQSENEIAGLSLKGAKVCPLPSLTWLAHILLAANLSPSVFRPQASYL
jgi:hypothetical protein